MPRFLFQVLLAHPQFFSFFFPSLVTVISLLPPPYPLSLAFSSVFSQLPHFSVFLSQLLRNPYHFSSFRAALHPPQLGVCSGVVLPGKLQVHSGATTQVPAASCSLIRTNVAHRGAMKNQGLCPTFLSNPPPAPPSQLPFLPPPIPASTTLLLFLLVPPSSPLLSLLGFLLSSSICYVLGLFALLLTCCFQSPFLRQLTPLPLLPTQTQTTSSLLSPSLQ